MRSRKPAAPRARATHPAAGDPGSTRADALIPEILRHLNSGAVQEGLRVIETALRLAPKHPELWHLAGQAMMLHLPQADRQRPLKLLQRAVELSPNNAQYRVTLANAYRVDARYDESLVEARKALRLAPRFAPAHTTVGIALTKLNRKREAAEAFSNAARLDPGNLEVWLNHALSRMELRETDAALESLKRVEALAGDPSAELLQQIGKLYAAVGGYGRAERCYRDAIAKQPKDAGLWFLVAEALSSSGDHSGALEALDQSQRLGYPDAVVDYTRARIYSQQGKIDAARSCLEKTLGAAQDDVDFMSSVAIEFGRLGDFAAQDDCLKRVFEIEPDNLRAAALQAQMPGRQISSGQLARLEQSLQDQGGDPTVRSIIGFTLGDTYRNAQDYDRTFRYYQIANRLKGFKFDEAAYRDWQSRIQAAFSTELFDRRKGAGHPSTLPVLIVGMPRSGTTLTEQVISAHPLIHGAGEYGLVTSVAKVQGLATAGFEAPIDQLAAASDDQLDSYASNYLQTMTTLAGDGKAHVTNKLPHNFQQIGLFALLFPNAPIIHVKRDPRDNLLSLYFQDFRGSHAYAYDLKTLGRYYRLYENLMAHWASVVPNPMFQLQYEELVGDLPGRTAALADFLGVECDERMLRFWEQDREVKTASLWQVRQPVYTSSIGRWQAYEKHLKPLFRGLGIQ